MELNTPDNIVLVIIIMTFGSGILLRFLTFIIKSRCRRLACGCMECERDVVSENNLRTTVLRDIELPAIDRSNISRSV